MGTERPFDVVVFGATGFTGRLVAEYLARSHARGGLRWAIAGRSRERLEAIRRELVRIEPACEAVGVVEARAEDLGSLERMAASARAVLTTVGPFARYGEPLVEACVRAGTHYADITGEPAFVDRVIERWGGPARDERVRLVSCCGFDSVPHDLGVLLAVRELPRGVPIEAEGFVRASGTFSGGTWTSAVEAFGRLGERKRARRARAREPVPGGRRVGATKLRVRYEREVGSWVVPLPTIDPEIVQRTARALEEYGPDFRYGHYAQVRSLPRLVAGAAAVGAIVALAQLGPTRRALLSLRKPGEGPSEEQRRRATFTVTIVARGAGKKAVVRVSGGDPGYDETAKMVAESALCLALDEARLPEPFGALTPAAAMGDALVDRLRAAGMRFEVVQRAVLD